MSAVMDAVRPTATAPRSVVLNPQRMALAEQWRQDWIVNAEEGTGIEDVLDTGYWAHMASHLQQFDRIEVRMETGEWVADLIVTGVGRNWAAVHLIAKHDLQPAPEQPAGTVKHEVLWRGQQHKWCVKRLSDGAVLDTGRSSKTDAQAWLANYETTVQKT